MDAPLKEVATNSNDRNRTSAWNGNSRPIGASEGTSPLALAATDRVDPPDHPLRHQTVSHESAKVQRAELMYSGVHRWASAAGVGEVLFAPLTRNSLKAIPIS
jgi:hypothetical protein